MVLFLPDGLRVKEIKKQLMEGKDMSAKRKKDIEEIYN